MSKMSRLFFNLQTLYEEEIANEYNNRKGSSHASSSKAPEITACPNGNWRQLFDRDEEAQPIHRTDATDPEVSKKEPSSEICNQKRSKFGHGKGTSC